MASFFFFQLCVDLDARPWDFQMEECTLRSCVDRFNNRRYLLEQAYMNAKNLLSNAHVSPHLLANANNSNIQVSATNSNIPNQMGFASSGVGTIGNSNGVNSNGKFINSY